MAKKESTILYDKHVDICEEFLTAEQFGLLMFALRKDEEPDFGDDKLLAMAFAFIALQKNLDDKKYEKICETNRKNAKLGGAPKGNQNARKQPKQPNAKKNNPNDNENEKDNDKDNENDDDKEGRTQQHFSLFGEKNNVELTQQEADSLFSTYERAGELIDKVSRWISRAENPVPDHYEMCLKFATNGAWPKKKVIPPVEPLVIEDPPSEEEQARMVAEARDKLNKAFG